MYFQKQILRRIAPHCIEETEGLFISLPEDGSTFRISLSAHARGQEYATSLLSRDDALELNPTRYRRTCLGAREGPDGCHRSLFSHRRERQRWGEPRREISSSHRDPLLTCTWGQDTAGEGQDRVTGEGFDIIASTSSMPQDPGRTTFWPLRVSVSAWLFPRDPCSSRNRRLTQRVINRCRKPSDGDIIVPMTR